MWRERGRRGKAAGRDRQMDALIQTTQSGLINSPPFPLLTLLWSDSDFLQMQEQFCFVRQNKLTNAYDYKLSKWRVNPTS